MNVPDKIEARHEGFERVVIQGRSVWLPPPMAIPKIERVVREDLLTKALAAWLHVGESRPQKLLLVGPVGSGKSTLVKRMCLALPVSLWTLGGKEGQREEDVSCQPRHLSRTTGEIDFTASAILAAAHHGGAVFYDEIDRAPEGALDVLRKLLDDDWRMEADAAGISFTAHREFRFCAACNRADSLPEPVLDRFDVVLHVPPPSREVITQLVRAHYPLVQDLWFTSFDAEIRHDIPTRCAISTFGFAYRLWLADGRPAVDASRVRSYIRRGYEAAQLPGAEEAS